MIPQPLPLLLALALPLAAAGAEPPAAPARPNVLVIVTDQQSGDALGCAGDLHLSTPNLDRLAARGTRFTRSYCTVPVCTPSRASLFTGRYPQRTGIVLNNQELDGGRHPTLGGMLQEAGYQTAYAGKWHVAKGFPGIVSTAIPGFSVLPIKALEGHLVDPERSGKGQQADPAAADAAIGFLRRRDGRPFLLVASFVNPHDICEYPASGALRRLLPEDAGKLPPARANWDARRGLPTAAAAAKWHEPQRDERHWREYRWVYHRLVEEVDRQVGRVLDELARQGLEGSTLVAFTSDHGDMQGAHCFSGKCMPFEESVTVPLIIAAPGGAARVDDRHLASGLDLVPTVLDYAGLEAAGRGLDGASLRPLAEGRGAPWRDHLVSQFHSPHPGGLNWRLVRTARWKYVQFNQGQVREQLFDLEADAHETADRSADPACAAELERHRGLLGAWRSAMHDDWDARSYAARRSGTAAATR